MTDYPQGSAIRFWDPAVDAPGAKLLTGIVNGPTWEATRGGVDFCYVSVHVQDGNRNLIVHSRNLEEK